MATKGIAGTGAVYWAFSASTGLPVPGDSANHTLLWAQDNGVPASITSPTIQDNSDGSYSIALTSAQATCNTGKISGTSSTSGVKLYGVTMTFEDPATLVGALTTAQASGSFWNYVASQLAILYPGAPIYIINPSSTTPGGLIGPIYQGTAYNSASNNAIIIPIPTTAWVLSSGTAVYFNIQINPTSGSGTSSLTIGGTVLNPGVAGAYPTGQAVSFNLSATQTQLFATDPTVQPGGFASGVYAYTWAVTAKLGGNCIGIAGGGPPPNSQMSVQAAVGTGCMT